MNILHIIGFLGADPEERYTNGGKKVWTLRIATRSYKNGNEDTIWWRVTVWGDQYDKFLGQCKKGKPLYIVAEMNKLEIYTDKNQQPQVSYEATARSLHFLPTSERPDQQHSAQDQTQRAPGSFDHSSHGNVQTGYSNNGNGFQTGYQSSYNQQETASYASPVYSNSSSSDEPLPF